MAESLARTSRYAIGRLAKRARAVHPWIESGMDDVRFWTWLTAALLIPVLASAQTQAGERRLTHPEWDRKPTGADIANVLDQVVSRGQPVGWALLKCHATAKGNLTRCRVIIESPDPGDMGKVALRLAPIFKLKLLTKDGEPVEGGTVLIPLVIGSPDVGTPVMSYAPGAPSFTVSPVVENKVGSKKIQCPVGADKTAICEARPFYWNDTPPLEEIAPIILAAGQTTGISTLYCRLTVAGRFETCQMEGENNPRVLAAVGKTLPGLKSPKRYGSDDAVAPAIVAIVYDWPNLTKAAQAIIAAEVDKAP
ncbi:hypothetical protein [Caulobacter sp. 1776]|uniref:hypothetical protein n=1 Tax=Caulobacter sp. 1776 TaxID=3156420 RepID=UPI0033939C2A